MRLQSGLSVLLLCVGVSAQKSKAVYTKAEDLTLIGKVMPYSASFLSGGYLRSQ